MAGASSAAQRAPLPPFPEGQLYAWPFDGEGWLTQARSAPLAALNVQLVDSWSGQALRMAGGDRALLALAERAPDGMLNLPMNAPGTVRFYFAPEWSSASLGGIGPGVEARLMEVGGWSGQEQEGWWSLSIDASGTVVRFAAHRVEGTVEILGAPIQWQAGQWHQIALAWVPGERTVLYLDGRRIAVGPGVGLEPLSPFQGTRGFCLGSDVFGGRLSQGQFEELFTFGRACGDEEVAKDYERNGPRAALGPVTAEEQAAKLTTAEQLLSSLSEAGAEGGATQLAMGSASYDPDLWLEIGRPRTVGEDSVIDLTLHNTVPGGAYYLWSTTTLPAAPWVLVQELVGAFCQEATETTVTMEGDNRFFLATAPPPTPDFVVQNSFEGLNFLETPSTHAYVRDSMGAVGLSSFVELINWTICVYDKADGTCLAGPMTNGEFFRIDGQHPQDPLMEDPRILYDAAAQRWVACAMDVGTTPRSVILAVSRGATPALDNDNWTKHLVPLTDVWYIPSWTNTAQLDEADYVTMGLDANGVYLSVVYTRAKSNHVVAIHKPALYSNPSTIPEGSLLEVTSIGDPPVHVVIQPAVNFDAAPQYAWLVAKGPATSSPDRGGAVWYRRVAWNGSTPNWVGQWQAADGDYRDYFDLDGSLISAPQKGGPQGIDLGSGLASGATGSRLMMAMIRDGFLWTCQQVGLEGTTAITTQIRL